MPRLIVATNNVHKTGEIAEALAKIGVAIEVVNARAVGGMPEVDETGDTFAANARLKAEAMRAAVTNYAARDHQEFTDWILADDSGLAVDFLGGAPGVYSSRYAGLDATDADNNDKLLNALSGQAADHRTARFVCCLVLLGPGIDQVFTGTCEGLILTEPAGAAGFGYDPLFAPNGHAKTFAQLGRDVKKQISHRANACQQLAAWLKSLSD